MFRYFKSIFFLLLVIVYSCNSGDANKILLENEVEYKMKRYVHNKLKKCKSNALEDAEIHVDSIITEVTNNAVKSDLEFPERPIRDTSSENFNFKIDSIELDDAMDSLKLFESIIEQDTVKTPNILK